MICKINFQKIKTILYLASIAIAIYAITHAFLFLHENFYLTITQSEEILILQKQLSFDSVDLEKFNMIIKKMETKTESGYFNNLKNPFE